ncbi:hypothetical protein M885DRAFT_548909 [Pelagophyceae sp. CCMP2097]|nr:hypothetical protein M885DRAFT_548909 [Pelagophyceae sp. CCMP2097]
MATAPAWFDVESPESDAPFDEAEVAAALLARRPRGVRGVAPQAVLARSAATAATKRAAKARTDAQRKDDVKSSAQEAGLPRVPGPLALLRTLTWTYELAPREEAREGTYVSRVDNKANADVLMSTLCEVLPQPARYMVSGGVHPKSGQRPCSTLFNLDAVCIHPNCGFVAKWKRGGGGRCRGLCDTAAPIRLFVRLILVPRRHQPTPVRVLTRRPCPLTPAAVFPGFPAARPLPARRSSCPAH